MEKSSLKDNKVVKEISGSYCDCNEYGNGNIVAKALHKEIGVVIFNNIGGMH